jgi:dTDP-6-deoxy-L-talose 4-dehydrogenase (NAD+)
MTTVAVTGASGFVGQHCIRALAACGVRVLALSRRPVRIDNGQWRHFDLASPDPAAFAEIAACHSLLHLAWGGLPNYQAPRHVDEELPLQRDFLSAVCAAGQASLVISGTCLEYGMQEGELSESMPTMSHVPYAVAKDLLRQHCQTLAAEQHLRLCWARLFYVYGPGQAANSLWSQLQAAIGRGDSHFPMSAGQQVRDFIPIEEAAATLAQIAIERADAGVVNLCSGEPITVEQRVRRWLGDAGAHMELDLGKYPYPTYEPFRFWGAREKLDQVRRELSTKA